MAQYGRGLICLTLSQERCQQLKLPLMVSNTHDKHATNFTVSIEAAKGVTTGISAADRAMTVRAAVAPDARPEDLVQPGHIFPLMAQPGGVISRAGHTEAGCDLARMAGLEPAAVIVEILNRDGSMARRKDLEKFSKRHGLKMGTIADLIEYRIRNEKTVERVAESNFPTQYGDFRLIAYRDVIEGEIHFALVKGQIDSHNPTLVRVQIPDEFADLLRGQRAGVSLPLSEAMAKMAEEDSGVIIVLRKPPSEQELVRRIRNFHLQDEGGVLPPQEQFSDLRTYGLGAQILLDIGVKRMRILGAPRKLHALSGFGLEVEGYSSIGNTNHTDSALSQNLEDVIGDTLKKTTFVRNQNN